MKRTIVTGARRGALVVVASLIILAGCSNPFQAGLGNNVDIDRPDGDIDSPDAGQYLSGVETLTGVHSDDTTTIPTVTLTLGDDPTEHAAAVDEDGWEYELNTTDLPDGELEVIITITDASGKSTEKRRLYYVDNRAPVVLVKNPQGYATNKFNGTVTVRGEAADRYAIDVVRVQILDDAGDELSGLDLADGTNSWTFEFDSRLYADPAADLQIVVQATDRAGNVSTTVAHYDDVLDQNGGQPITVEDLRRIAEGDSVAGAVIDTATLESVSMDAVPTSIDNDLDKPTVSFVSPQNGQTVGGSVLVTGTAFDDDGLDRVEMRIDLNGDGDYDDTFDLNGDGDETDDYETESNWVTLAGTVLWTQELNADGELYQVETGHNGQVAIQVRAVDINGIVGNPVEIAIRFDDTIPRVEGLEVDGRSFLNGISVSGTFPLRADIRDDEQVNRVRISYDGGITYRDVYDRSTGVNDGSITVNADNDLTLDKTIDTSNIPDIGDMEEGPLYIRLLVFDNNSPTPYQVLSYVTLNVDNVYPTGAWDTSNVDPLNVSGSDALVQGTAEDTGSVSGVEEVHVYFVDDGQVYDLSAYDTATPVVTTDFGDGNGNVAYTPRNGSGGDPPYEPPYYRIEIDNEIEGGDDTSGGGDGDGFDESLTLSGGVYTWSAQFDSTMIPDGPIDIHYVVFDSAGNGTHYVEPGFIKNNRPVIDSVEVGTDLDYSNAVEFGERFTYAETRFTARGRIYFNPTILGGNGATTYEVYNATDDPGLTSALTLSGNELDISATGENLSDQEYDFVIRVTDSVGIQV
ncbi:MAG: Ig-like domain-containing protein, partial [Spirochaetota bacterium]